MIRLNSTILMKNLIVNCYLINLKIQLNFVIDHKQLFKLIKKKNKIK